MFTESVYRVVPNSKLWRLGNDKDREARLINQIHGVLIMRSFISFGSHLLLLLTTFSNRNRHPTRLLLFTDAVARRSTRLKQVNYYSRNAVLHSGAETGQVR